MEAEERAARMEVENARHQYRLAQLHCHKADAAVKVRELVSPHEGIVVAILKSREKRSTSRMTPCSV